MNRAVTPLPVECFHGLCLDSLTFYRRTEMMMCVLPEISWCFILRGHFIFVQSLYLPTDAQ